jgi:hypothetical protein
MVYVVTCILLGQDTVKNKGIEITSERTQKLENTNGKNCAYIFLLKFINYCDMIYLHVVVFLNIIHAIKIIKQNYSGLLDKSRVV